MLLRTLIKLPKLLLISLLVLAADRTEAQVFDFAHSHPKSLSLNGPLRFHLGMTVSLLVGTLRTLAHFTDSPSEILNAMNQRMLARNQGGFTTCLVLRAAPDYTLTVANAGHPAPYLQGSEMEIINGLPLGLAAESAYPEVTVSLPENSQLTLLTDGVVEARARTGELLGFERTAALATKTAEIIAHTAQNFGQQDDITVLTLSRSTPQVLQAVG